MGTMFHADEGMRRVTPCGFYRSMGTSLDDETILATELWRALVFMHGRDRLLRRLRRDPAKVFTPLAYGRARVDCLEVESPIVRGLDSVRGGKPGNEFILTPDHSKWPRFVRDLRHDTADFDPTDDDGGTFEGEDVPCAAQSVLAALGMAVAESLVVLRAFGGATDLDILRFVHLRWHDGRTRRCFDAAGRGEAFNGLLG